MIKKTLIVMTAAFVLYNILIVFLRPESFVQNQWQSNVIKAQEYAYGPRTARRVIVGTSLSEVIFSQGLPDGYFDLSFPGGSPLNGFEIMKRSGILPECILVESNYYARDPDSNPAKKLFVPGLYEVRRYVPSLREKYQPVNVIAPLIFDMLRAAKRTLAGSGPAADPAAQRSEAGSAGAWDTALFDRVLEGHLKAHSSLPDGNAFEAALRKLSDYIGYFKSRNVVILFYEIPVHPAVYGARQPVYLRERLAASFRPGIYDYIPSPDCRAYRTSDAVHLDGESARRYREFFFKQVDAVMKRRGAPAR